MRRAKWIAAALGVSSLLMSLPSYAAATSNTLQFGLGFRYGKEVSDSDLNRWGTGIGLEVGYTLPVLPIFVGGQAEYFFGGTLDHPTTSVDKVDGNIWQLSLEGGYDFGIGDHLVLRPKLGFGLAHLSGETCIAGACISNTDTKPLLAPGARFILMVSHFQANVDLRYAIVTSDPAVKAWIFGVGVGF